MSGGFTVHPVEGRIHNHSNRFFYQIKLIACINCLAFLAVTSLVSICWLLGAAAYLGVGVCLVLGGGAGVLVERVHQPQVLLAQLMAVHHDGSLN